jgi:hypothetical protein
MPDDRPLAAYEPNPSAQERKIAMGRRPLPWYLRSNINTAEALLGGMSGTCRAAWDAHEAHYVGGYGGGRITALRAFIAAWEARGPTLSDEWARLVEADRDYQAASPEIRIWRAGKSWCASANQVMGHSLKAPERAIATAVDCAIELAKRTK